ncbi:hypothetical protein HDU91_004083 [Kappamyces sp. JEL0680]|nr:hypothetical protein HDU91_004083 [Kappamyces sp. JEL0680]
MNPLGVFSLILNASSILLSLCTCIWLYTQSRIKFKKSHQRILCFCQLFAIPMNAICIAMLVLQTPLDHPLSYVLAISISWTNFFFTLVAIALIEFFGFLDERITKQRLLQLRSLYATTYLFNIPVYFNLGIHDNTLMITSLSLLALYLVLGLLVCIASTVVIQVLLMGRLPEAIRQRYHHHNQAIVAIGVAKVCTVGLVLATIVLGWVELVCIACSTVGIYCMCMLFFYTTAREIALYGVRPKAPAVTPPNKPDASFLPSVVDRTVTAKLTLPETQMLQIKDKETVQMGPPGLHE